MHNPFVSEINQLRTALSRLAGALPDAEARLVQASVHWTPESAVISEALHREVTMLRAEVERIASELEKLLDQQGGPD